MSMQDVSLEDRLGPGPGWRHFAAAMLRSASRSLDRLALRLSRVDARVNTRADAPIEARARPLTALEPLIEFHAEAGAPEGALYVNGLLIGHLQGVNRL